MLQRRTSGGGAFLEYRNYLSTYKDEKAVEIVKIKAEAQAFLKNLKEFASLTSAKIRPHQKDPKIIQNILASTHLLRLEFPFPAFQKVAYFKMSPPQSFITCFGATHQKVETPFLNASSLEKELSLKEGALSFEKENVTVKMPVLTALEGLEGILEIEVALADLKAFLGIPSQLVENMVYISGRPLLQENSFSFYTKAPLGFWAFVDMHRNQYALFAFCALACLLLLAVSSSRTNLYYRRVYQSQEKSTKEALEKRIRSLELSEASFEKRNADLTLTRAAFEAYRKLHESILKNQQSQEQALRRSLNTSPYNRKDSLLTEMDHLRILQSSIKAICSLAQGRVAAVHHESIALMKILEEIKTLFGERIQRFNIMLHFSCSEVKTPKDLSFQGDPVFVAFLLINIIGKALHRVPNNGKVSVSLQENAGSLSLEVQDNGYAQSMAEEFSQKSFVFLLKDQDF